MSIKKLILFILDGWGIGYNNRQNAIYTAKTPFYDKIINCYPNSKLKTHGQYVGLPNKQVGNSEVGHMNIGSGRILSQELSNINNYIIKGHIYHNNTLHRIINYIKKSKKNLHIIGLLSDGGVHSHINHLKSILSVLNNNNINNNVYIHGITDGRDTNPCSALSFINEIEEHTKKTTGILSSIIGRFYAMDRDMRWQRTKIAYDMLVYGKGQLVNNISDSIKLSYSKNIYDEFILPILKKNNQGSPITTIKNNDAVIFFNYRTDRARQITQALTQNKNVYENMISLNLFYATMTCYDKSFTNIHTIFHQNDINMTLGEVLSLNNKKQLRIAESEKYPHITYFFSGGREKKFKGEDRILISSPKVSSYDIIPQMSIEKLNIELNNNINTSYYDFICVNYANPDMVGHTGVFQSTVSAIEYVDKSLKQSVLSSLKNDYSVLIISDHGNAEYMIDNNDTPFTAHTSNLVPCIIIDKDISFINNGRLCDIAPTILKIMDIVIPKEMNGKSLV